MGFLKFNVDDTVKVKPGTAAISGVVRNEKGEVLAMF